ncbi:hypothetical protein BU23DRAFT_274641 [Bimuria novae-zelandiae CBS 107.79]|uniref:Uncharacterized protein n=1 Tax=Bimuria novae-zelandiae CBS 107.79 TaxID=1447943 RepID=A0A6A5VJL9_9PLEO|nr:hypothetical protein BU23DRAFT_274641 [Bimuria novae-zelandiae CBS 107.79]
MTHYFPHASYAEDQTNAHAILYIHVARAAAMSGSFLACFTAGVSLLASSRRYPIPITLSTVAPRLLTHSARGLVIGSVAGVAMTYGHMYGREEIEWQDRACRLQENRAEGETDVVSIGAALAGANMAVLAARAGMLGAVSVVRAGVGGAGLGMGTGVGYMISTFLKGRKEP